MNKNKVIKGTFILTTAGLITKIIGFYYRIFLSKTIGAEGMGLYQMIFPIYGLCFALSVSGVQTAISKYVAAKNASNDSAGMIDTLKTGLYISLFLSILSSFILYFSSGFIASDLLRDLRCKRLLQLAALSVPLGALHSCINSYYLGQRKTFIPGFTQLIEQIIRVFSVYVIATVLISSGVFPKDTHLTPEIAVIGLILGEAASSLISLLAIFMEKDFKFFRKIPEKKVLHTNIISMAAPLTLNRVIMCVISSLEAILIPFYLQKYGLTQSNAISIYGVLTGMAMPFIFFPSTLTNAISSMILPSISEADAMGNMETISFATEKSIKYSLSIGIFCTGFFTVFGNELGVCIFDNYVAGAYITILAWLCPFLYLCATLASILNGLGCTKKTFRNNLTATIIRMAFIIFAIPNIGIKGYLFGILFSEIVCSALHIMALLKVCKIKYEFTGFVLKPAIIEIISLGISLFTFNFLKSHNNYSGIINLVISGITGGIFFAVYLAGDVKNTISS